MCTTNSQQRAHASTRIPVTLDQPSYSVAHAAGAFASLMAYARALARFIREENGGVNSGVIVITYGM